MKNLKGSVLTKELEKLVGRVITLSVNDVILRGELREETELQNNYSKKYAINSATIIIFLNDNYNFELNSIDFGCEDYVYISKV